MVSCLSLIKELCFFGEKVKKHDILIRVHLIPNSVFCKQIFYWYIKKCAIILLQKKLYFPNIVIAKV